MSDSPVELVFQDFPIFVYGTAPRCGGCSRVTDPTVAALPDDAPPPTFDVSLTFDGALVVTGRFRSVAGELPGAVFSAVAGADDLWLLDAGPVVRLEPFDSHVGWGPRCETCGEPRYVTRSGPLVLEPDEVLPEGFSRSDIGFGDTADFGPDQPIRMRPSLFADRATAKALKAGSLLGVHTVVQP